MAEQIAAEEMPPPRQKPFAAYPWDLWMNGAVWKAVRGEDFHTDAARFAAALHGRARRRNLRVRTHRRGDIVKFQFTKP